MEKIFQLATTILINSKTIKKDVEAFKEKFSEKNSSKDKWWNKYGGYRHIMDILNGLVAINEGREIFVSEIKSRLGNLKYLVDKIVVNKDKFNKQRKNIFNYFRVQNISYNQLLTKKVKYRKLITKLFDPSKMFE